MSALDAISPALRAAREADDRVRDCLESGESFLLEAGAGAGKTYSLVETLRGLIDRKGRLLRLRNQRIACITYTNAATGVINSRIDGNPLVYTDTIHAFFWSLVRDFQPTLREIIGHIPEWIERLREGPELSQQRVEYDLGHRRITDEALSLHHDDVLAITVALLPVEKFQRILANRYPYILIDEYQDTNKEVMDAITSRLLGRAEGPQIGLFGDHWQRIYDGTCGHVRDSHLTEIGKKANFRSTKAIVQLLNKMRPELPQAIKDESLVGSAVAFHTNTWQGQRRTGAGGGHWKDDLPPDEAHNFLQALIQRLTSEGWDFAPGKTKILMLTHNVLATEQGYAELAKVFPYTDLYIKKEDEYIAFFLDKLEPACAAFASRKYGEMHLLLGSSAPLMSHHADKVRWFSSMEKLLALRQSGSIGDLLGHIASGGFIRIPDAVLQREQRAERFEPGPDGDIPERISRTRSLKLIPYREVIALDRFINGHTPFATKHSVKGDEFENVLVVFGRGWNRYNFDQYLEWAGAGTVPPDKAAAYERYRNLFYVSCSRPTTRLALLFTQKLSDASLRTLQAWLGNAAVRSFDIV